MLMVSGRTAVRPYQSGNVASDKYDITPAQSSVLSP